MKKIPLEEALKREEYLQSSFRLPVILGYDDNYNLVIDDLSRTPHILIGGVTGSGKSIFIQNLLACLTSRFDADEVQLALFDLKMVEFDYVKDIPHLYGKVVTDIDSAIVRLQELVNIMNDRKSALAQAGVLSSLSSKGTKGLDEYNAKTGSKLPRIVAVFDEYAELIMQSEEAEDLILKLVSHGHGVGIHLIIASQRTCDEIFSSTLRAIVPTRAVFKVGDETDSMFMLGYPGAELLPCYFGEMIYFSIWAGRPQRIRVPFIGEEKMLELVKK